MLSSLRNGHLGAALPRSDFAGTNPRPLRDRAPALCAERSCWKSLDFVRKWVWWSDLRFNDERTSIEDNACLTPRPRILAGVRLFSWLRMEMAWNGADLNRSCLLVNVESASERLSCGAFAECGRCQIVLARNQQLPQGVKVSSQHCQSHIAGKADFCPITTTHHSVS